MQCSYLDSELGFTPSSHVEQLSLLRSLHLTWIIQSKSAHLKIFSVSRHCWAHKPVSWTRLSCRASCLPAFFSSGSYHFLFVVLAVPPPMSWCFVLFLPPFKCLSLSFHASIHFLTSIHRHAFTCRNKTRMKGREGKSLDKLCSTDYICLYLMDEIKQTCCDKHNKMLLC